MLPGRFSIRPDTEIIIAREGNINIWKAEKRIVMGKTFDIA